MKLIAIVTLCLACLATGCATRNQPAANQWPTPHPYVEADLTLSLAQDHESSDLALTLENTSSAPITNRFPETLFEGTVWVLQEGAVPLKTYPSNYFCLLMHALWTNPLMVISPGESVTYTIPLQLLISPLSKRQPAPTQPAYAYAVLDKFDVFSNMIRLEKPESIQWPNKGGAAIRSLSVTH